MLLITLVLGEETITLLKLKLEESIRQTPGGHELWMNWFRGVPNKEMIFIEWGLNGYT